MAIARRKSKNIERRDEILDTAIAVLASEGLSSVTMRSIADRIGIHLSTLQYYFPTKRDLLKSTIERIIGPEVRKQDEMTLDRKTEPKALLHRAIKGHLKASCEPLAAKLFAALWGLAAHDSDVEDLLNEVYERDCKRYSALISKAAPALSRTVSDRRAVLLLAQLEGLILMVSSGKLAASKHGAIRKELLALVDNMIKKN